MRVSAAEFKAKAQAKRELYRFLTHECGIYLDTYDQITVYHMRDLAAGKRRKIPETSVKNITVPHFEA